MKILSFVKKNILTFILIVLLLVIQALGTITLPEYISKIVDTGIRNNGLENSVPEIIRESEMKKLQTFFRESGTIDNFKLMTSEEYFGENAPVEENVYVLKENVNKDEINYELARAISVVQLIDNGAEVSASTGVVSESTMGLIASVNSEDIWGYLNGLDSFRLRDFNNLIDSKLKAVSDDILLQISSMYIVDEYELLGRTNTQMNYIIRAVVEMLLITLVVLIATVIQSYLMNSFTTRLIEFVRGNIFNRVLKLKSEDYDNFSITSLINRTILDTQILEKCIPNLIKLLVYVPIIFIGAYLKIRKLSNSTDLENVLIIIFAAVFVIGVLTYFVIIPKARKMQTKLDEINSFERDSLNNLFLIKGNAKKKQQGKFSDINKELVKENSGFLEGKYAATITSTLVVYLAGVYMLWQGGIKIDEGTIGIGSLMAIMDYLFKISFTCIDIFKTTLEILKGIVSYGRCKEILNGRIDQSNFNLTQINKIEKIEFKNVYFKYEGSKNYVLEDFSLILQKGEHVALVGKNASGKSTIIKLLLKLYEIEKGEILINDINIKNIDTRSLRKKMGVVLQETKLFEGRLSDNIKFGNDTLKDKEVERIKEIASLDEFKNIDQNIVYKGKNVSGGQKQRIAIARALAMNPDVVVLDNAYSSVDEDTKKSLQTNMKKVCADRILLDVGQEKNKYFEYTKVVEL